MPRSAELPRLPVLLVLLASLVAPHARAQSEFDYGVEEESRVWLRALLDVRVARGGRAPSWTDSGPGKTRYGGELDSGAFEHRTRLALSQLAIELGASLPWNVRAQAQIHLQPDLTEDDEPWLVEALLRREWGAGASGFGLQAGLMNVPFSLEHVGPAWSPEYAISASALDSWLWEEISLAGLEGEWWRNLRGGMRVGVLAGAGFGPDQLARLLALRGWVLGDGLSGLNADLPLPSGERTEIFDERDDRPAGYLWLTLGDTAGRATVRLGGFDNFGDQSTAGVWHTRFSVAGATFHPHPDFDLVLQYLRGEARVLATTNDSSLRAWYALLSHRRGRLRLSVRYDSFRLEDVDGGNPTDERGDGVTFAWIFQASLRHRFAFEHVWLESRRPAAAPERTHDGWQLSYRFRY